MSRNYTRERLAEAVHCSASLSEALGRLGREPTSGRRRYARRLLREWDIDASHLNREGVRHTERRLREAVRLSRSTAEVVRRLGISPVGGNQAHIGRRIAAFGIDPSHFSTSSPRTRSTRDLLVLGIPEHGRTTGSRLRKALLGLGREERCADCGIGPEWNGRALRLEVDHINGDWWDNRPDNLRMLCPNCHAATDTFRGRKQRASKQQETQA